MASADNKPTSRRTGWINGLLLLLFSLGSLWLADLAFRAYERHFLLPVYPEIASDSAVNLAQLSYNDGLVSRATTAGEFRVLSFGDSFTYSVMEPALSYNGIVERSLNEALPGQSVRVVNLGEPGTGPSNFRSAYDYWSQIFQHDAVLFHIFLGNDVRDDAYMQSPLVWEPNVTVLQATHPFFEAGSKKVPAKFPLRMMDYAYAAWLSHQSTSAANLPAGYNWAALTELDDEMFADTCFRFLATFNPQIMPELVPGYQQVLLLLLRAQEIAESGTQVAVVLGPSEPMVNDELRAEVLAKFNVDPAVYDLGLQARIIETIRQRVAPDVAVMDMTQAFRVRHQQSGEKLYFRQNTHWDLAGNDLAGLHITDFLLQSWFSREPRLTSESDPAWPGPELIDPGEIEQYLSPLLAQLARPLPVVTGAARDIQMFDGVIGNPNNWAMAELGQAIELQWDSPQKLSELRIHLYHADGRSYGLLVEGRVADQWQILADRRNEVVSGELFIKLSGESFQALRLTGTSNSKQLQDPANHFIHIEEIEWSESN